MRRELRKAYRCGCAGETWDGTDADETRTNAARASRSLLEKVTGHPAREATCPWAGFYEAEVFAVMRAHRWFEKGQAREWWGDDPEAWLVEGVEVYHDAIERTRNDVIEMKRKK